jgi:hypothetical protein
VTSFPQVSPQQPCTCLFPPPYVLHALPLSFFCIWSPAQYWVRSTDHSAPHWIHSDTHCVSRHKCIGITAVTCVMWSVVPVAYVSAGHLWTVWTPANKDAIKEVLVCELWYPTSRVRTRPKPSDFSGKNIYSMPSFRGEVKPSVPCRSFAACTRTLDLRGSRNCRPNWLAISRP